MRAKFLLIPRQRSASLVSSIAKGSRSPMSSASRVELLFSRQNHLRTRLCRWEERPLYSASSPQIRDSSNLSFTFTRKTSSPSGPSTSTKTIRVTTNRSAEPPKRWPRLLARKVQAILLGSIATGKYREILLECFGERLLFPADFVGRGDMSRGALLLRAARAGLELTYIPAQGAIFRGKRAPRLERK